MKLKVGNKKIDFFNQVYVSLKYNTVGSVFSFSFQFDPDNPDHRDICRPCAYQPAVIEHNGEILITGVILSVRFIDSAVPNMVSISGYSKTGVLEDCQVPSSAYPLQSDNINLRQVAERILKPFGIKLIVDSSVAKKIEGTYQNTKGGDTQTVKQYLAELAAQRHIILTHDNLGNLVMTEAKAAQASAYDFDQGTDAYSYELAVDGQRMHSNITVNRQAALDQSGITASVVNPFVNGFRPRVVKQSSPDDLNTSLAARNLLSEELQSIQLKITISSWELNGKIIRPNSTVTVQNPRIFLYQRSSWFVESVDYQGDQQSETATLTCVRPEVYTNQSPQNIFK